MDEPSPQTRIRLYDLAETLAADVALTEPNWCDLAEIAEELTTRLRTLCPDNSTNQEGGLT